MRIHVDKISSSTKNVPLKHEVEISKKIVVEEGAVLVVKVLQDKKIYNKLELTTGRFSTIHIDDILVVTLGNRRALKGFVGEVPKELKPGDIIHLLNLGGVAGTCTSANKKIVGQPLKVEVIGAIMRKGKHLNIKNYKRFSLSDKIKTDIPLVIISGSCMEVGKTTAASEIIKAAAREGYRVCGAKVAGIAAMRDAMSMEDYGAVKAISMIDAGYASTATEENATVGITKGAINYLAKEKPDFIIVELGDGIFGEYGVMEILKDKEVQAHISAHIGCAGDPMSAMEMYQVCRRIGVPLHVVSGPVTDNSVGINFIKKQLKVAAINCLYQEEKLFAYLKNSVLKK